ncbi:hypothetical protein QEG98_27115 [Myxococcus sp. MxC21-1]|uniref:hypothetical protein n=1 Tax=Myxococcus sp. MxC21-1 TaxID=3041439 RepID=UPI002931BE68|nr:hypothetical protein [Myxococcus sp. MxC21-1]WNZ59697.1 hypothetical protein QEG98_27115 [Myxococcus sp. MxC21-1]
MRYFAMVAAGATLWGCWALFFRPAGLAGPQNAFLVLLAMSLPAPFLFRRDALRDRRATLALLVVALADAANTALFFAAMERGPVSIAVLTHYRRPCCWRCWPLGAGRRALHPGPDRRPGDAGGPGPAHRPARR